MEALRLLVALPFAVQRALATAAWLFACVVATQVIMPAQAEGPEGCPKPVILENVPRLMSVGNLSSRTGDVEFLVLPDAIFSGGAGVISDSNPDGSVFYAGRGAPEQPRHKKYPSACPQWDSTSNNLCEFIPTPNGGTVCICEIDLKPTKGKKLQDATRVSWLPNELDGSGGWFKGQSQNGAGVVAYTFYDAQNVQRSKMEVRDIHGSIWRYELSPYVSQQLPYESAYMLVEHIDGRDNSTKYEYDAVDRIIAVHRPDGITEHWNYAPTWVGGSGWDSAVYSGIEITYTDRTQGSLPSGLALPQYTNYMVFLKKSGSQGPLRGDRLFRVYNPKKKYLSGLPGSIGTAVYDTDAATLRHQVMQLEYVGSGTQVVQIQHCTADGILPSASVSPRVTIKQFTYVHAAGRLRVETEHDLVTGEQLTFSYVADPDGQSRRLDLVTVIDNMGTTTVTELDDYQRPTRVTITPQNNAAGRPRAFDSDAQGKVEPVALERIIAYASCVGCSDKPTRVEVRPVGASSGRVWEYEYNSVGLLTRAKTPNPNGSATAAVTEYSWSPLISGDANGTYKLDVEKTPDGKVWTYSYETSDRFTPPGEVSRGKKIKRRTRASPQISGGATPSSLTDIVDLDFNNPALDSQGRQNALIGFMTRHVSGDGIETTFQRNAIGHLTGQTTNPNGVASERLHTLYVPRRSGLPSEVTTSAHSSMSRTTSFAYSDNDQLESVSSVVGAQTIESRLFYDEWSNLAVVLERNATFHGGAPDDFGSSPRSDIARAWLRHEMHYSRGQLVASLEDRRSLDRNESGPLVDDEDARFLLTTYVWNSSGLLEQIGNPNGSTTSHVYDGYKTLYRSELASPGQSSVVTRRFTNDYLEVVRLVEGQTGQLSVTDMERNAAGVLTRLIEPTGQVPIAYPATWSVTSAIHEFTVDAMGRPIESRTYRAPGASVDLLVRQATSFDEIGRPRLSEIFEGSSTVASQVFTTLWEGASKVKRVTGPGGRYVERTFDDLGRVVEERDSAPTNPNKVITEFEPKTDFVRKVKTLNWDEAAGSPAYVTREVEYVRDALGRVLQAKYGPASSPLVHAFTYYANGQTEAYTDPSGKIEKYLPDAMGRLVERFRPQGVSIWNGTTYLDWTGVNDRSEMRQSDGLLHVTRTIFDFAGRLSIVMEPGSVAEPTSATPQPFTQLHQYDALSRLTDLYTGDLGHVRFLHNSAGQIIGRYRAGGNEHVSTIHAGDWVERNALGQITKTQSILGGGNGVYLDQEFNQDALGRTHRESFKFILTGWTDIESSYSSPTSGDPVRWGVNYDNNLANDVDDLWVTTTPDAIGRMQSVAWRAAGQATATPLASYWHEGGAIRRRQTSFPLGASTPNSFTTDYTYDPYGRMSGIDHSFSASASVDFHYDDASNLLKEVYEQQGLSGITGEGDRFSYDDHNRLLKAWMGSDSATLASSNPDAGTFVQRLTYGLDQANNRTTVATLPGGGTETPEAYVLQSSGQGPSNRYESVGGVTFWYDDRGNLIFDGENYLVYDAFRRVTEVWKVQNSGQQSMMAAGTGLGSGTGTTGQSSSLSQGSVSVSAPVVGDPDARYIVEDVSALRHARASVMERVGTNLLSVLASNHQSPIAPQLREELGSSVVQATPPGQGGSSSFATGQAVGGGAPQASSLAHSQGELSLVLACIYLYDYSDRRVTRWLFYDSVYHYAYDGWEEVQEIKLGVGVVKQFVWGEQLDELVAFRTKNPDGSTWSSYYVAEGGAHCPSRVLDSNGNVVEIQEYDPYGKTSFYSGSGVYLGETSAVGNPFGWKGHRVDPETGLVYMRHRYYAPQLGRFMSQDPLGTWADALTYGCGYSYGGENPLVRDDPMGLQIRQTSPVQMRAEKLANEAGQPGNVGKFWQQAMEELDAEAKDLERWVADQRAAQAEREAKRAEEDCPPQISGRGWLHLALAFSDALAAPNENLRQAILLQGYVEAVEASSADDEGGPRRSAKAKGTGQERGEGVAKPVSAIVAGGDKQGPAEIEQYNRNKHYPNAVTEADRKAIGVGPGEAVDHDPPLVRRYYEGDPEKGEKPGYQMTPEERKASASDRTRMRRMSIEDSRSQGGHMKQYSMRMRIFLGIRPRRLR